MSKEEDYFDNGNPKPSDKKKNKRNKQFLKETSLVEEEHQNQNQNMSSEEEASRKSSKGKKESRKSKKKKHLLKENVESVLEEGVLAMNDELGQGKKDKKKKFSVKADKGEEGQQEIIRTSTMEEDDVQSNDDKEDIKKKKRKRRLLKEAAEADKRGVCYLSRIPPHMDPFKLRQILSQLGDIQRIYLTPENPGVQPRRKRGGKFQEQGFSEGWVEFSDKRVAKRVADMLNGEQIGGRKRSSFYYDLWNIKYLSKFKWDDLTEEIAYKNAVREQKLALEISAAKRERDFYLSKVDKARALSSIEERLKKKQKLQQESGTNADHPVIQQASKVVRNFQQKQPVADHAAENKPKLSKDILAGVFGGS